MLNIKITGLTQVAHNLGNLAKQVPYATSRAINATAKLVQKRTYEQMRSSFDRPTPYALRSLYLTRSDKSNLTSIVGLRQDAPGKGMAWSDSLSHQFTGGARRWRRFESALSRIGVLPFGMAAVPPKRNSWAITLDQYGNVPRGLIVVLLSYFKAFGEQGYKANATDRSRRRRAKLGRTDSGYRTINGVMYFIVTGRDRHTHHFTQPGIYAKRGIHGSDVAPVLLFVRKPSYQRRIDLEEIGYQVVGKEFNAIFERELANAIATAR